MASRIENILTAILNDGTYEDEPRSRIEAILLAILNETAYTAEAQSRIEAILLCILNGTDLGIVPQSRVETILECIYHGEAYTGDTQSRIEELLKQISEKEPTPPTPTTFTATFIRADGDGGGTLYTQTDIPAGTVPVYGGETPTTTKGSAADYPFKGWTPALAPITEDTVYTAVFGGVEVKEITDSWDQIIASIDDGSYVAKYNLGNYKPLDLGTEGIINMQIVAMDADELADGSGTAPITFVGRELLAISRRMNPARSGASGAYNEGTGAIGGWGKCEMRNTLKNTVKPKIPDAVRARINNVTKYSRIYNSEGSVVNDVVSIDDVWIPSRYEMCGAVSKAETQGAVYTTFFTNDAKRIKAKTGTSSAVGWATRTASGNDAFYLVGYNGASSGGAAKNDNAIALGFCLGRSEG